VIKSTEHAGFLTLITVFYAVTRRTNDIMLITMPLKNVNTKLKLHCILYSYYSLMNVIMYSLTSRKVHFVFRNFPCMATDSWLGGKILSSSSASECNSKTILKLIYACRSHFKIIVAQFMGHSVFAA